MELTRESMGRLKRAGIDVPSLVIDPEVAPRVSTESRWLPSSPEGGGGAFSLNRKPHGSLERH